MIKPALFYALFIFLILYPYMTNKDEAAFLHWWEANRAKEKKWIRQLSVGLPVGIVFGLPILLSVFFRGWYKRMPYVSGTQLTLIMMACLAIAVFYAVVRMHVKWEENEQRYQELIKKREVKKDS
jgi:protein-S-isoprenylcysteine O-methyltransferase Ste14